MPRFLLIAIVLFVSVPAWTVASAQEDEVPLGDLARQLRNSKPPDESQVIDNDNFTLLMDKAESERLDGQPIFAISPSGRTFTAVSPDGVCSLSFVGTFANHNPAAYIASDLPQDELLKLDGPASITDGALQVSLHNRTQWDVKEIVVGLTVLQGQFGAHYRPAIMGPVPASTEKPPDLTILYHLKGNGAPDTTTIFRAPLGGSFGESKDWHWAIVGARGIPPAAPGSTIPQSMKSSLNSSPEPVLLIESQPDSLMNSTVAPQPAPPANPQR